MKVWLLMRGEYSDKTVVGVFSSRESALLFRKNCYANKYPWQSDKEYAEQLAQLPYDYHDPIEVEVDTGIEPLTLGMEAYLVRMHFDGDHANAERVPADEYFDFFTDYKRASIRSIACCVWATSPEHAIKIANERRVQWRFKEGI